MLRRILLVFLLAYGYNLFALDFYWVGGSGSWTDLNHWATTSGGAVKHIHTPNSSDNVFFDANSCSTNSMIDLNIPIIMCHSLDVSGLSVSTSFIGICKEIKLFGSLKLGTYANWGLAGAKFSFESQQTNNQITSNHCFMPLDMYFNGINGGWTLTDSLFTYRNIYHNTGNFNTAGNSVFAYSYSSNSAILRTLNMSNSLFKCYRFSVNDMGFTVSANQSKIILLGSVFSIKSCGNQNFYDLECRYPATITSYQDTIGFHEVKLFKTSTINADCNYNTLHLSKGNAYIFGAGRQQNFNTDLIANGSCSNFITVYGSGTSFYKSGGGINLHYIVMSNCIASGSAVFNAYSSVDLGGNSGWNIHPLPSRNLYWVGGTGLWEDSLHWAVWSGGIGGVCIPRSTDNVFFDNNSFTSANDTVIINDTAGNCRNMQWNTSMNPVFYGKPGVNLKISGSLDFCSSMSMNFLGKFIFISKNSGEHLQTANFTISNQVNFDGKGSWTLLDSLKVKKTLTLSQGDLHTNSQYVYCNSLMATGYKGKKLFLGNSRIDIEKEMVVHQDSCEIDAGTSSIHLYSDDKGLHTINTKQRRFWNLIYENDADSLYPIINVSNTFIHKLIYKGNIIKQGLLSVDSIFYTPGYEYLLKDIDTIHSHLHAQGFCTKNISIKHLDPMGTAYIYKNSGSINLNKVNLRGINTDGNALFIANNASDLGNNTGWTFTNSGAKLFWVGDSGNWSDSLHWATTSGGIGGSCIPTIFDSVYFDTNSFLVSGALITVDCKTATCKDMIWDTLIPNPKFHSTNNNSLYISGNLNLSPNMNFDTRGLLLFCDTTHGKYIISNQQTIDTNVYFIDSGEWNLLDNMTALQSLYLSSGQLNTNGNDLLIQKSFYANLLTSKTLNISNSKIIFTDTTSSSNFFWFQPTSNSHLIATHSKIIFNNSINILSLSGFGSLNLNEVYFKNPNSSSMFSSAAGLTNHNKKMVFRGPGQIYGNHSYDTLAFGKNSTYMLAANNHQYINHLFKAIGYCGQPVNIEGFGGTSYIHKASGSIDFSNVELKNIEAQGGATFNAYGGKDLGGNTNWTFIPNNPRTLYWIGGSGQWNDSLHWSLSSGGNGGECFPTPIDDVFVDANSPLSGTFDTLSIEISGECHNLNWHNADSVNFKGLLDIYGGLNLNSALHTNEMNLHFLSKSPSNTIRTGNNKIKNIRFNGSGSWNMSDSLIALDSINFYGGTLSTQNKGLKAKVFCSTKNNYSKTLNLGSSKILLKNQWIANTDSLILHSGHSEIIFEKGVNYAFTNTGKGSLKYYNVAIYDENTGFTIFHNQDTANISFNKIITYNNTTFFNKYTMDSLIFAPGNTYKFQADQTQKINKYWRVRGNNCYAINLESTKTYFPAILSLDSANVEGDFINMRDITATGNTPFYAGKYSTDIDNNSGWIFKNAVNYNYGLGPDTSFVIGKNIVIGTSNFNTTSNTLYLWSTGSTHDTIVANKTGWYAVTITYGGNCSVVDSIYVGCNINMQYQITNPHCYGDTNGNISLIIPDTSYTYSILWNTGDSTTFLSPYPAGPYVLTISTDSGKCFLVDTVSLIDPPEVIVAQGDTSFCQGDSVRLDLGSFAKYFWHDSLNQKERWVSIPDTFRVMVEDLKGCQSKQDTLVVSEDARPNIFLGNDTTICKNSSEITLTPGVGFDAYLWSDNSTLDILTVYEPGTYWVRIKLKSCTVFDSILIDICPSEIDVPNVFTPNGDGYNDVFRPINLNITNFDMTIFNRWGNEIYHTENIRQGWDGTYHNKPAAEGVYFYIIEYRPWTGSNLEEMKIKRGTVTLLRNK